MLAFLIGFPSLRIQAFPVDRPAAIDCRRRIRSPITAVHMWYTQTRTELVRAELTTIDKRFGRRELTRVGAVLRRSSALFESMSDPQNRCVFPVAAREHHAHRQTVRVTDGHAHRRV